MTTPAALASTANAGGSRIDLHFTVEQSLASGATPERPALRIVRRQLGFPSSAGDGEIVTDFTDVYRTLTLTWERLERFQFRTTNTADTDGTVDADVTLFYDAPAPGEPLQMRLRFFDPDTGLVVEELIDEGSHVERSSGPVAGWQNRDTLEFFHTPGGGPEESAGVLAIFTANDDPTIDDMLEWTPATGPVRAVPFDTSAHWFAEHSNASVLTFDVRQPDEDSGIAWLIIDASTNVDTGTVTWSIEVRDRDLEPWTAYYYAAYDLTGPTLMGQAVALATADYDSPRKLFLRLPGAYQRADEPDPTAPTGAPGPLRRFLEPVGNTVDLARSIAQSVRDRHDARTVRVDILPHLARMIGWSPDLTASAETQRRDIGFAPEIFGSVGTIPNARALVNRVSSWPTTVHEFVNNITLTNSPESIRLWELWSIENDGTSWTPPAQLTLTTDIDAHPALATDAGGTIWLFFHSDRGGRRAIWRQRIDGVDALPVLARTGASDDTEDNVAVEQDPAVVWDGTQIWSFWSSDREGQWDIWARTFDGSANAGDPIRLTDHAADDGSPAAVVVPGAPAHLWLFWSSRRRGPTDIWMRVLDLGTLIWGDPERVTSSPLRDDRPAATLDASGNLWLFWTRDDEGRQTLWSRTHDGTSWGPEISQDVGHARDVSPAAVPWKTGLFLLWHSNDLGFWQIWGRTHDGTGFGTAARLSPSVHGNKEPAATVDAGGNMRVVWRSQRRARRYRSRTIDVADTDLMESMGTKDDYAHYTYDTGTNDEDWYSRESAGLFLDTAGPLPTDETIERLKRFVEPFRPVPVRLLWLPDLESHTEVFAPDPSAGESWDDSVV